MEVPEVLTRLAKPPAGEPPPERDKGERHLSLVKESLQALLKDPRVPGEVKEALAEDYREIEAMFEKIEHEHIHIAVFGRVSVGKSALLNALLGEARFVVSPLHGATRKSEKVAWQTQRSGGIYLIDTPGINEVGGEERERIAVEVAERSDLILFVVEGDLTETEHRALRTLVDYHRPVLLVFNKVDRYTREERKLIREVLERRTEGLIPKEHIIETAAQPAERIYIQIDEAGREQEVRRAPPPDVEALRLRLWEVIEREGKTLAALNAGLFAGKLSDQVAERIAEIKRGIAQKVVRTYSLGKGIAVALNPVPVADLLAASAVDVSMIVHLGKLYDLPVNRREAGMLLATMAKQMALLMGTVWGTHLLSSALKGVSLGLSTLVTAGAQGAVAYYNTYIIGQAAERYFVQGKSWGEGGPKQVIQEILENLDRDSLIAQAKGDILAYLKRA